jgi:hypothetical protein
MTEDQRMKPTPIFAAAAGFAMIGACTVESDDNAVETADLNAAVAADQTPAPAAGNSAGADTLGNQLNQLNESDSAAASEASNASD